jgi:hypothetical protein
VAEAEKELGGDAEKEVGGEAEMAVEASILSTMKFHSRNLVEGMVLVELVEEEQYSRKYLLGHFQVCHIDNRN